MTSDSIYLVLNINKVNYTVRTSNFIIYTSISISGSFLWLEHDSFFISGCTSSFLALSQDWFNAFAIEFHSGSTTARKLSLEGSSFANRASFIFSLIPLLYGFRELMYRCLNLSCAVCKTIWKTNRCYTRYEVY